MSDSYLEGILEASFKAAQQERDALEKLGPPKVTFHDADDVKCGIWPVNGGAMIVPRNGLDTKWVWRSRQIITKETFEALKRL